jgi:hypothetical protein
MRAYAEETLRPFTGRSVQSIQEVESPQYRLFDGFWFALPGFRSLVHPSCSASCLASFRHLLVASPRWLLSRAGPGFEFVKSFVVALSRFQRAASQTLSFVWKGTRTFYLPIAYSPYLLRQADTFDSSQ